MQANVEVSVSCMWQLNKRDYQVWLTDGRSLLLRVVGMFDIVVTQDQHEVARIGFQPLSSLNNIEMPPVYRIASYHALQHAQSAIARTLLECMLCVYRFYTNGSIKPLRDVV